MRNLWSERDARALVRRYARDGVNRDRALRVYSSRLLGSDDRLVMHGGGNTSVKTIMADPLGEQTEVLCIKGSGWDLRTIEPAGLPAVRLEILRRLIKLDELTDEDMVNMQRTNLLDSTAPNPSVETLLHAFLPHTFIDHTHANAVLALTDQVDGDAVCRRLFGRTMGYVPYIMPGFALAKKAFEVYRKHPDVEGLILFKHGIFTFGDTAREAYGRMIDKVTLAEKRLARGRKRVFVAASLPKRIARAAEVAPILRGLLNEGTSNMVLDFRTSRSIRAFVDGRDVKKYSQRGTATPDHVIRLKRKPMVVPAPDASDVQSFAGAAARSLRAYTKSYHAYFERQNARLDIPKKELDPLPRVVLVPGLGLFGAGNTSKAAAIAGDLAEANVEVITGAESLGSYKVIPERDAFDIEYWSLEQAKLGGRTPLPMEGMVCAISGGGSGIGAATAHAFARQGCEVAVLDLDAKAADQVAGEIGGLGLACDVTSKRSINSAMDRVVARFGGVDIVVSNAGAAWQGQIGEVSDAVLRKSFELNFWGHQNVARKAVAIMQTQGTGGCLLFNASKQALNPGRDFGPYGLPKAATLFLMRQYAVDYGGDGIRSNAINADRIRSGMLSEDMIASRSRARGLDEAEYMAGNLLGKEVRAEDVAAAFVYLASAERTTAAVLTVDGGNIAASVR